MSLPPESSLHVPGECACAHCGLPVAPSLLPRRGSAAGADEPLFCCSGCRFVHALLASREADQSVSSAMLRIGLGIFFGMNLMVFSFCFYGADALAGAATSTRADAALEGLFRWLLLLLGSGVMLTLWIPIARGAWEDLRRGRLQAALLIAGGALAAYVVSAASVVRGTGPLYFDSASMILLLVTIGQYLEAKMKTAAVRSAEGRLLNVPDEVTIETPAGDQTIRVANVRPGQIARIAAGQAIAVDGEIERGHATIDASLLTGESEPQRGGPGAAVFAGSLVLEGLIWVRATSGASQRRIETIIRQLHDLQREPAAVQRLADRVASLFIPATIVLALGVLTFQWARHGDPVEGVMRALAVALIACPCALGLTAPLVISAVASHLARHGVVVRSARALELAATVRHIFFDKTGTLTTGDFRVQRTIRLDPAVEPIPIAAALERASRHPIARAWSECDCASLPDVAQLEPISGLGVRGIIGGRRWFIGRIGANGSAAGSACIEPPAELDGLLPVALMRDDELVAWFGLAESIRSESAAVLNELHAMHVQAEVLTGDSPVRAGQLAAALALPVHSLQTPESKRESIRQRRIEACGPVAFAGDGINDALALAEADLGITVAGGSDLAHASGQVSLLEGDLHRLTLLLRAGRVARRRIALALCWSFAYNTVGLTLAALGMLTPAFAAIAMVLSSAITIIIASRTVTLRSNPAVAEPRTWRGPALGATGDPSAPLKVPKVHPA